MIRLDAASSIANGHIVIITLHFRRLGVFCGRFNFVLLIFFDLFYRIDRGSSPDYIDAGNT